MKKAPILVPSTAPAGGRGKKTSSSGQTTPRDSRKSIPSSPDRARKVSSAAPSTVADEPARATAWTTRPSLVGVIAANRLGMGLLRKIRASNAGSKRESTCGDRSEHPLPNLEPTYRLESKAPFQPARVEEVIKSTLDEHLKGRSYRPKVATMLCRMLSDEVRERVKKLGFDRYRCVVTVLLGEKKDQGVMASSRCNWDDKRDNYASYTFQAPDFFCTATVYGVYKE